MRVDQLPENQVVQTLAGLKLMAEELKSRQKLTGVGGLLGYLTNTDNQWDLNQSLSGGSLAVIEIIFTASGNQQNPFVQPYVDLFFGGTAEANRPDDVLFSWDDGVNFATVLDYLKFDPTYSADPLVSRWTITFTWSGTLDYFLKAYVAGSSDGTLQVNRVS